MLSTGHLVLFEDDQVTNQEACMNSVCTCTDVGIGIGMGTVSGLETDTVIG